MALSRMLVVSLMLLLAAPSLSEAALSVVALGGRSYVDAVSLASHLGAKVERTPDRVYLRTRSRVITFTRGWARVEVDGKGVVLEAPVLVERDRWLVPEAFMRQVMPLLAPGAPRSAPAPTPASAPAPAPAAAPSPARAAPAPAAAAAQAPVAAPAPVAVAPVSGRSAPAPAAPVVEPARPAASAPPAAAAPQAPAPVSPPVTPTTVMPTTGTPTTVIPTPRPPTPGALTPGAPTPAPPTSATPTTVAPVAGTRPVVGATIQDVRLRSYPTFTRVVVETSVPVRPRVEVVTPNELRVRLPAVSTSRRAEEVGDGLLEAVHVEPADGEALVRVTFTGGSQEPKTSVLSDPPRLLFDFPRGPEPSPRAPLSAPAPLRTLVLDAGHGGHDSGAVGPAGLMEKDLVLDVTRRVATLVEAHLPGIRVLLSRRDDTFVTLRERTSFANRERADLFVSIHGNAHRTMASEGVETYFLSSEATDSAARQVAASENSVVKLEKPVARGTRAEVVKAILWDLAQSEFQQESSRLAEVVQDSMTQSLKIPNRGVKQAGFYVLGGAAMPAILVEIGFVTNPREERRLKDTAYRDEIARAIFAGIAEYKHDLDRRAARAASR